MKKLLFISSIILIFLSGCASKEKIVYVTKTKIKYVEMPADFYSDDITIPKFPSMRVYLKANPYQREKLLVNHVLDLYNCIGKYKLKLKSIYKYNNKIKHLKTSQENN